MLGGQLLHTYLNSTFCLQKDMGPHLREALSGTYVYVEFPMNEGGSTFMSSPTKSATHGSRRLWSPQTRGLGTRFYLEAVSGSQLGFAAQKLSSGPCLEDDSAARGSEVLGWSVRGRSFSFATAMADVFDCVWNDWCCRVCLGILYVYIIRTGA